MKVKEKYVAFITGPVIDEYYVMDGWPKQGDKQSCVYLGKICGGMIGNAACVCAGLGASAACLDIVPNNEDGEIIYNSLIEHGVDVSHIVRSDVPRSGKSLVMVSGGERNVFVCHGGERERLKLSPEQLEFLRGAEYVYSELLFTQLIAEEKELLRDLKAHGVKIVFDTEVTMYCPDWFDYMRYANTVFTNESGIEKFREGESIEDFSARLFAEGVERLVITLGANGCRVITESEDFYAPSHKVKIVDTTGAGDTFNATFLTCVLMGMSDQSAALYANAAGAMSVMGFGPQAGITTFEKIERFLEGGVR